MTSGSTRRPAKLAAATLATLVGCGGDAPPPPPVALQGLTLDTLFAIGAAAGESWEAFGGIWDVEVGPDGLLAVLDIEAPAVHVYDQSGAHVASVSETGLDAGALDRPAGIAWSRAGELLVWDPGSSWISSFAVDEGGLEHLDGRRAFAFGETGFCSSGGRIYLSYWQDGQVVHEIGPDGPVRSFAEAPHIPGVETLGPELQEIATEELTPSGLLCASEGVLDVSFFGSHARLLDRDGAVLWERELEAFNPLVVYTPDGMGLGRRFDPNEGSHLLRSVVPWGDEHALVQHELRTQEFPEEGEVEVIESRLVRLEDGLEVGRTRDLPLILAAHGNRLFSVRSAPYPQVVALEASGER
jgi:hypothetical protein